MSDYPCIICQNGDAYSNIVCDDCQDDLDFLEEVHDQIECAISRLNKIYGSLSLELGSKIREEAHRIHYQIYQVNIKWKEVNGRKELDNEQ